jgi:uncharacterized protein YjbI with pentapeptide repeats
MDHCTKSVNNGIALIDFPVRDILMLRKPVLLLSLLDLMLKLIAGQTKASSNQPVALPQHPPVYDRSAWRAYWKAQSQPWRTEPEIDEKRQGYLADRRSISPDIEQGSYPLKGIKLNRADVEWLLATHENGCGPVDWTDESQRGRIGLDLRAADLSGANLRHLPLARLQGGLTGDDWRQATPEQRCMAAVHMERAILTYAHLEESVLTHAHMQGAVLNETHLESADAFEAHFEAPMPTSWHGVYFDASTKLYGATIANDKHIGPRLFNVHWDGVRLTGLDWASMHMVLDEYNARKPTMSDGKLKSKERRRTEYEEAVHTYRQLDIVLQSQGLNEDAVRFAYHAQRLQKTVYRLQMIRSGISFRKRLQAFGVWLFSWFLFIIAGYGYRLWRSFFVYALVIIGFTTAYYLLGASFKPPLSLVNALGLSMTSFHGRGFFPGVTQLDDTMTILTSIEAFVGLVLEATFIATLTQRFFGK